MGVDAINLSDTLTMVVSQHLVNTLCPYCKLENEDGTAEKNDDGCETCEDRGVLGRTVVYEMAWLDDMARESIIDVSCMSNLSAYVALAATSQKPTPSAGWLVKVN